MATRNRQSQSTADLPAPLKRRSLDGRYAKPIVIDDAAFSVRALTVDLPKGAGAGLCLVPSSNLPTGASMDAGRTRAHGITETHRVAWQEFFPLIVLKRRLPSPQDTRANSQMPTSLPRCILFRDIRACRGGFPRGRDRSASCRRMVRQRRKRRLG